MPHTAVLHTSDCASLLCRLHANALEHCRVRLRMPLPHDFVHGDHSVHCCQSDDADAILVVIGTAAVNNSTGWLLTAVPDVDTTLKSH